MGHSGRLGEYGFDTEQIGFLLLKSSHQLLQYGNRRRGVGAMVGA
jgi:hypothetical protein